MVVCACLWAWNTGMEMGCATPRTTPADHGGDGGADYDPKRAFLPLDRIKPDPDPPARRTKPARTLPTQALRRLERARELYAGRRYDDCIVELDKALRRNPDSPRIHRALALAHRAAGHTERVRTHVRKAIALDGDDIVLHYLSGRLAFEDQQNDEAIRQYRIALKASDAPEMPAYSALCHYHLAKALNAAGYLTAAVGEYRRFEQAASALPEDRGDNPDLDALLAINHGDANLPISVLYEKLGRFTEAVDALAAAIRVRPPDAATRERFARLLVRVERFDEALAQARLLVKQDPRGVALLVELHELTGHPRQVVADLARLRDELPRRDDVLMAYADALERFDRLDDAARVLSEAVSNRPDRAALRWRLFDARRKQGDWAGALDAAAGAVRADALVADTARRKVVALGKMDEAVVTLLATADKPPDDNVDAASAYLLGSLAAAVGRPVQAERYLRWAVRQQPAFLPARVALAGMLLDRCNWQAVIDLTCDKSGGDTGGGSALERLCGRAYAGLDDTDRAEQHLSAAIRMNQSDIAAKAALAEIYREAGDPRRATQLYESILRADPQHESAREALIHIYQQSERHSDAAAQLAELRRRAGSPHRVARCTAYLEIAASGAAADLGKYCRTLEKAVEEYGPDSRTFSEIGRGYLMQERFEEALSALRRAVDADPHNLEAVELRMDALRGLLDYEHAAETARSLLRCHPNRRRWIDALWRILVIDHRYDEAYDLATQQLNRAGLSDEQRRNYRLVVLLALERLDRNAERIAAIETWRTADPDDPELAQWLIDAYSEAERHDDAVSLARREYEADPRDHDRWESWWRALGRAERFDAAQQLALDALATDPDDQVARDRLVDTLVLADRHADALELLDSMAVGAPLERMIQIRDARWRVLIDAGRFDAAIEFLTSWMQETRAEPPARRTVSVDALRQRLIQTMIAAQRYEAAIAEAMQWINETEDDAIRALCYGWVATCHQQQGDAARAIDALQQAHDLNPRGVGVNNDLGYSLADAGRKLDEAERMIRFALRRSPYNGAFIDSFGWLLYKRGRFAQALRWLKKASETAGGDDPVVYEHLGDVAWRLGRRREAVQHWTKSVELGEQQQTPDLTPAVRGVIERVRGKLDAQAHGRPPQVAPLAPGAADGGGDSGKDERGEDVPGDS